MKYSSSFGLVGGLEPEAAAAKLKECGYDGIELSTPPLMENPVENKRARAIPPSETARLCAGAEKYVRAFTEAGIEIMGFAPGYFAMDYFDDDFFEPYYELAAAAGSPSIKVAGMRYNASSGDFWSQLDEGRRKLEVLTRFGGKFGVRSLIELHFGFLSESCSGARIMLRDFDPNLAGVIHDPQNMVIAGMESWRMGLEILGEYIGYVHFKNSFFRKTGEGAWKWELCRLSEGLVDWGLFINALKDTGFSGYLCNEYRGDRENTPEESYLVHELNYIKKLAAGG